MLVLLCYFVCTCVIWGTLTPRSLARFDLLLRNLPLIYRFSSLNRLEKWKKRREKKNKLNLINTQLFFTCQCICGTDYFCALNFGIWLFVSHRTEIVIFLTMFFFFVINIFYSPLCRLLSYSSSSIFTAFLFKLRTKTNMCYLDLRFFYLLCVTATT